MKVNDELRNYWGSLLKPVFPDGTELEVDRNASDFKARASWKIGTDPNRPNKMSKTILVIVPAETADDYANKDDAQQQPDDMKLQEFVRSNLANHDPDHNNPREVSPPVVEWVAGSNVLNS